MEARDIILRPVITEASTAVMDEKRYTFDVDLRATKTQVKNAVEEIFDVKVVKVNIMNLKGKQKRFGRFMGKRNDVRKAYVTLAQGQEINFAQEVK